MSLAYPYSLRQLSADFRAACEGHADQNIIGLARQLIQGAIAMDLHRLKSLGLDRRYTGIVRDQDHPAFFEHQSILGAPWADHFPSPLELGEAWNQGRRAANTGVMYALDARGYPQNPYVNAGLDGRGVLGQFGPNHAIDNGLLVVKDDAAGKPALMAMGILRKYDGHAPAFSGGFVKFNKSTDGHYIADDDVVTESRAEEFFEEMVSGSITLLPNYQAQLDKKFAAEVQGRMSKRGGQMLSPEHLHEIRDQVETGLKLEQVKDIDSGFFNRLREVMAAGKECYAGPVLNSTRTTNNAWVETRLNWVLLDDETWNYIRGDAPVFDYQFSAGDDASGVQLFKMDRELFERAFESHGAMFVFMAASFLIDQAIKGRDIPLPVVDQLQGVAQWLEQFPPVPATEFILHNSPSARV